ncbi:MAG: TatD family hydrolase [Bacteroidales bacterium]|jgi:TatD DNase family protein|nr:TatD family hydrolase [Bacteroidales bacterium]
MEMIDTHAHLYEQQFDADRDAVIARAVAQGVRTMLLPNIDTQTIQPMLDLCHRYPGHCYPMLGLHPTAVDRDFAQKLELMEPYLDDGRMTAIGETGIDLYWDKQYRDQQIEALHIQIGWAKQRRLPLVIHCRQSYHEVVTALKQEQDGSLTGVFHCFPGNERQADEVVALGFMLGIGGVATYKNADMAKVVRHTDIRHILTETDAPYLSPSPYRGKRNESAYIFNIVQAIAEIKSMPAEKVAEHTVENALKIFAINRGN